MTEDIILCITGAISEINQQLAEERQLEKDMNAPISSVLDSLSLISFIVMLEEHIERAFHISVTLTDDEVMWSIDTPLKNVASLAEYLSLRLKIYERD